MGCAVLSLVVCLCVCFFTSLQICFLTDTRPVGTESLTLDLTSENRSSDGPECSETNCGHVWPVCACDAMTPWQKGNKIKCAQVDCTVCKTPASMALS